MKIDKKTSHKKNVLINNIDIKYREIENFEYQYVVLKSIDMPSLDVVSISSEVG